MTIDEKVKTVNCIRSDVRFRGFSKCPLEDALVSDHVDVDLEIDVGKVLGLAET